MVPIQIHWYHPTNRMILLKDAEAALASAAQTGLIDTQHVAILGHSMGSGVALSYGSVHPDTFATIAISPVSQTVTPELPHNLLLMAGSLEPQFVSNAEAIISHGRGSKWRFFIRGGARIGDRPQCGAYLDPFFTYCPFKCPHLVG